MPELPDVERFRRFFRANAAGRTVGALRADPTILRNCTPRTLSAALRGRRFDEPARHGKWLIAWTDGPALLMHFGMTGYLLWADDEGSTRTEPHRHDRLVIRFDEGGELRYRNMRKLGGLWLAHDPDEVSGLLGTLGPDALSVGRAEFLRLLARRRGGLKAALMDQTLLAGVGNLMADEILWQARLHPTHPVESLTAEERLQLHSALRRILRQAVATEDYAENRPGWLLHVRGRPGASCPRCRGPLSRMVAAGRTTYFCQRCQP